MPSVTPAQSDSPVCSDILSLTDFLPFTFPLALPTTSLKYVTLN